MFCIIIKVVALVHVLLFEVCVRIVQILILSLIQTGLSAIHIAAQYGRTEVVREILRQADIGDIRSEVCSTSYPSMLDEKS
jgi:hypothetical protein